MRIRSTECLGPRTRCACGAARVALVAAMGVAMVWRAAAGPAVPIELRDVPLLFVDDASLAAQSGVVRTMHPARTRSAPVIQADQPWEGDRVYTYGSVHYDAASGLFRLWYMSRTQRPDGTKPAPELRGGGMDVVLYATSPDGVRWTKPALGDPARGAGDFRRRHDSGPDE